MKPEYMDVSITVQVDLDDCGSIKDAYRKSERIAQRMTELVEGEFEVTDWYEVFRNKDGDCTDWEE